VTVAAAGLDLDALGDLLRPRSRVRPLRSGVVLCKCCSEGSVEQEQVTLSGEQRCLIAAPPERAGDPRQLAVFPGRAGGTCTPQRDVPDRFRRMFAGETPDGTWPRVAADRTVGRASIDEEISACDPPCPSACSLSPSWPAAAGADRRPARHRLRAAPRRRRRRLGGGGPGQCPPTRTS
jgi:hypothetical protein